MKAGKTRLLFLFFLVGCHKLDRLTHSGSGEFGQTGPSEIRILVGGQSNGTSTRSDDIEPMISATKRVSINGYPADKSWETSISWIVLGDYLVSKLDRNVKITNVSHNGKTSQELIEYLPEMTSTIRSFKPAVFIWVQGESDTVSHMTEGESYSALKTIFDALRQADPSMKIYIAKDGLLMTSEIRRAQQRLIDDGEVRLGVDIDQLRLSHPEWFGIGVYEDVGVHFIGQGLIEHGKMWGQILEQSSTWN